MEETEEIDVEGLVQDEKREEFRQEVQKVINNKVNKFKARS